VRKKEQANLSIPAGFKVTERGRLASVKAQLRSPTLNWRSPLSMYSSHLPSEALSLLLRIGRLWDERNRVKANRRSHDCSSTKGDADALGIRLGSLDTAFKLRGSYAPRNPPKEAEQFGVKVLVVDIPRPPRNAIDVTPPVTGGRGTPFADNNPGHRGQEGGSQ